MGQHAATMPAQSEAITATLSAAWSKLDERYRNGTCAENMSATPLEQPPELAYEPSEISAGGTPPSVDGCAEGSPAFVQTFFREMGHMPPLFDGASLSDTPLPDDGTDPRPAIRRMPETVQRRSSC